MATRKTTRVFILIVVVLFFVSAFGLTFAGIWEQTHDKSSNPTSSTAAACNQDVATESVLPLPVTYTTTAAATALQTTDLTVGTGVAAKAGDCLVVKYYGTIATTGTVFDETFDKPTGFAFPLGQGQVIPGWDQGLVGIKAGGTRRLVIPASLAYGASGSCKTPDPANPQKCDAYAIPPDTDLVFVVKLLRIQ